MPFHPAFASQICMAWTDAAHTLTCADGFRRARGNSVAN
jgi:hypothetical protein